MSIGYVLDEGAEKDRRRNAGQLLPCPCCGGDAEFAHPYWPAPDVVVECQSCYLRTADEDTEDAAANIWNRREELRWRAGGGE